MAAVASDSGTDVAGTAWAEVDHATHSLGLTDTGGVVSTTGVARLPDDLFQSNQHIAPTKWG